MVIMQCVHTTTSTTPLRVCSVVVPFLLFRWPLVCFCRGFALIYVWFLRGTRACVSRCMREGKNGVA